MFAFSILFILKGYKGQKGIIWVKPTKADDDDKSKGDDEKEEESSQDTDESQLHHTVVLPKCMQHSNERRSFDTYGTTGLQVDRRTVTSRARVAVLFTPDWETG